MNVNYNSLGRGRETNPQKRRKIAGSAPQSRGTRISMRIFSMMLVFLSFGNLQSQVSYTQDWAATGLNGWSTSGSGVAAARITTAAQICGVGGTIRMEQYYSSGGQFISPLLGFSNEALLTVSYSFKATKFGAATTAQTLPNLGTVALEYGPSASGPWTVAQTINSSNHTESASCSTKNATFTPPSGNLYIRFNATSASGADTYYYFDDVVVTQAAAVPCSGTPDAGSASLSPSIGNSGSTFIASVSGATIASGLTFQWQKFTAGTWSDIPGATTASSSITAESGVVGTVTNYRLKVTCSSSGQSAYSTTVSHTLALVYCDVSTTYPGDYTSAFSTTLANTNVSYTATSNPAGSYTDQTSQNFQVGQGLQFSFSHAYVGGANGLKIWIDYSKDGTFDANEEVFYAANSNATKTGSIVVPTGTPLGVYRMRVRSQYGSTVVPPACGEVSYGTTLDYSLNVIAPPSCIAPIALTASNITTTSVDLGWTASSSSPSQGYDYYVSNDNVAPTALTTPTGNVAAGITTVNLSNLSDSTTYYFWIRANCAAADQSIWSTSGSFVTLCNAITSFPWAENFESVTTPNLPICWQANDVNADGDKWISYSSYGVGSSKAAGLYTDGNAGSNNDYLVLPKMSLTGIQRLKFHVRARSTSEANDYRVVLSTTGNQPADFTTVLMPLTAVSSTTMTEIAPIDLSAYSGEVYIAVHVPAGGLDGYYLYLDNFSIYDVPACTGTPDAAAIASSVANVCVSGSVTLTATIPTTTVSGLSYQWYNSTGAISGATTAIFTTPVLNAAESFYFTTTCTTSGLSADSNTLSIAVTNPQVLSTTAGSTCGEGSVSLSATASSGAALNWYATASGGSELGSGETFTTPSISTTTDFYVEASEGGSSATGGVSGPIGTSSYADGSTGLVFSATKEFTLNSVVVYNNGSAGTLIINLTNSSGAILQSSAAFSIPAGSTSNLAAYTASLGWNIPIGTGYRLIAASGTTVSNSSLVRDTGSFGSYPFALGTVGTITGGYFGGSSGSYYNFYNWSISTTCSSVRTAVTATVDTAPTLTLSSATSTICAGTSTNTVTIATGASNYDTFVWSPSTGVTGNAADGFVFSPTTTTIYTLTANQSAGSLCSNQVTHTVNVIELPSAVIISPVTATTCANSIQALTATGGLISTSGSTIIGTDTTLTIENGAEPTAFCNRYEHYWLQMVFTQAELNAAGIQEGTINGIKFNITTIGSADFVTDYRVKVGATTEDALTGFTTTGLQEVFSAATYTMTLGVNSIAFSTPYEWDGTSNIILDVRNTGADSANNSSTYYTATTSNRTVTARTSTTFASSDAYAASSPAGTLSLKRLNTTFDWTSSVPTDISWSPTTNLYTDAAATVPYTGGNSAVVYVKNNTVGSQVYTAAATTAGPGCTVTASTTLTTIATEAPIASAQTFCNGATVADLVAAGTEIQWYSTLTGGTALANTAALATGTYYVSQTVNTCESARTSIVVTVNTPAAPTASAQTFCNAATIADLVATGTAVKWYADLTGGTMLAATTALSTGTYYVSQTVNTCESARTSVAVTVNTTDAPTATAQTFCGDATVADLVATGTAIQWYSTLTGGTALANTVALATGTYYASQIENACESARTAVLVNVNNTAAPTALAQTFCMGATVTDLVAAGTDIQWYSTLTGGTALANTTALATGTYYASQTINACESTRIAVEVLVNTTDAPTASAQMFCNDATVADLVAAGTDIQWYSTLTGGTALANTTALATGTYYASQTSNACESARTSVTVTVNTTAAPTALAQTFCMGATVTDLVATGTDVQWYSTLTGGTALANTAALATGTYYASQTLNACESERTLVEVSVNALPTATITRVDDTLTVSEENATYQWVSCGDTQTPIAGATSQTFTATAVGSYAVIVTQNGCTVTSECFDITTLSNKAFDAAKLGYYPNPVTNVLTVSHTDIISSIQVFDITGRIVRNMKVNATEVTVDMVNMPAAVYIVKVFTNNTSGEFKVVKK